MKDADHHNIAATTADARAPAPPGLQVENTTDPPAPDTADPCRLNLARALQLGELLHLRVLIDESGWLRGDIEVAYQREPGNTIRPITVRIAMDARDEDVLADGGPVSVCGRYNAVLAKLGQLARRLAAMGHAGRTQPAPGSPLAETYRELEALDANIAARQAKHMGHGVARLQRIVHEARYLERRHAELAAIMQAADPSASATWDGDTEDVALDVGCGTQPPEDR